MYEELVNTLRKTSCFDCDPCDYRNTCEAEGCFIQKAADAIEELSRRETPMRLRTTTSTKRCPACNKQLSGIGNIHSNYQFCRWCGQALDWTEPPKEEG